MKKIMSFVLTMLCILNLVSCKKNAVLNDFYDYEDDCMAIVQFVLGYDYPINDIISSFTIDINDGYIKIDDSYQSAESLIPSIERIREKGFTYIEMNKDFLIFWEDNGFYGWLWSHDPVESLDRITEGDRPYMKSQKITNEWYEVRTSGSF